MLHKASDARKGGASISNTYRNRRGQSLVEFALISIILFTMIMGIIEASRLLFTYSVISNAAQEGSRYGITRPRDVIPSSLATQIAATGTPTYIPQQVAPDGSCNVIDKAREKVWGINRTDVQVDTWYDLGDSTPVVVNTNPASPSYYNYIIVKGNRIAVEATYNFHFMVPVLDAFTPNGIDVKIRSARTIMSNGDTASTACAFNPTPAPTYTASPTPTGTETETPTPTETETPTPTDTPADTPTATTTGSPMITLTPTVTQTPSVTNTPSDTPTDTPISIPTGIPTAVPTLPAGIEGHLGSGGRT